MRIYKLYVFSTTDEYYFTSKIVAKRVKKLLENTPPLENKADSENVELSTVDVDPKFFTFPSIDKSKKVPYDK